MNDVRLDGLIRSALEHEAERGLREQAPFAIAIERLERRVSGSAGAGDRPMPRRAIVNLAWLVVVLASLLTIVVVGSQINQDRRPVVQARPYGFGAACDVELDPDVFAELISGTHDNPQTVRYRSTGLVTDRYVGSMEPLDPAHSRESAVNNTFIIDRQLTPAALDLVRGRIAKDLDGASGCYTLRTWESEGTLTVRTDQGVAQFVWSQSVGDNAIARLATVAETETIRLLAGALTTPHMWLPAGSLEETGTNARPDAWLVHVVLDPSDLPPGSVVVFANGQEASGTDGRYAAIELPGDAELATFGEPMSFPAIGRDRSTQRCAVVAARDAVLLARSLDAVALGEEGQADLFTPDMTEGIFVELLPVHLGFDCAAFEADLREVIAPPPPAPTPEIIGDLANLDPCDIVPASLRGRVDQPGYGIPGLALGVAARSCVLALHAGFGLQTEREQLWLYPSTVTVDEAATLATMAFGDRTTREVIAGHPAWLNHCLAGSGTCIGALAVWVEGHFLVLEVHDSIADAATRRGRAIAHATAIVEVVATR